MNYRIVNIATHPRATSSILIIYTGGTIGMTSNERGVLVSFNFRQIVEKVPALKNFNLKLTVISFPKPLDSSDIHPQNWIDIAYIIHENYKQYDGFVVLHGTDTMAYTASAVSFLLEGLNKPVIFTGAQLPIGESRTDAAENLITALEIAGAHEEGNPVVPEVCIYFDNILLRGNRSKKMKSSQFSAFESENYPPLAVAGISIEYHHSAIKPFRHNEELSFHAGMETNVALLKLFPGIRREVVHSIFNIKDLKGVVMETYGSGNAPSYHWFLSELEEAIQRDIVVLNVSQCVGGEVQQGKYATSLRLKEMGIVGGGDLTSEAAITKLMYLLSKEPDLERVKNRLSVPLRGEMD